MGEKKAAEEAARKQSALFDALCEAFNRESDGMHGQEAVGVLAHFLGHVVVNAIGVEQLDQPDKVWQAQSFVDRNIEEGLRACVQKIRNAQGLANAPVAGNG